MPRHDAGRHHDGVDSRRLAGWPAGGDCFARDACFTCNSAGNSRWLPVTSPPIERGPRTAHVSRETRRGWGHNPRFARRSRRRNAVVERPPGAIGTGWGRSYTTSEPRPEAPWPFRVSGSTQRNPARLTPIPAPAFDAGILVKGLLMVRRSKRPNTAFNTRPPTTRGDAFGAG